MKKNLTIIAVALLILAMAIPASAASLSLGGKAVAAFSYDFKGGNEVWNYEALDYNSRLELNLTFKEGDAITAYLPLVVRPFVGNPVVRLASDHLGNPGWYFAYDSAPWSFFVSQNDSNNKKQWEPLGDPMKVVNDMPAVVLVNAKGQMLGASFNLYSADLGTGTETLTLTVGKEKDPETGAWTKTEEVEIGDQTYSKGNAWIGRVTYPLPFDFTLGAFGVYRDGLQEAVVTAPDDGDGIIDPADVDDAVMSAVHVKNNLIFGGDLVGKVPALGEKANLTLALVGQWNKTDDWKFEKTGEDNLAYTARLNSIQVGPVGGYLRYTAVGANFVSPYKIPTTIDRDRYKTEILNRYAKSAAAEAQAVVDLPVGIPAKLTLGDTYWMDYPSTAKHNATTGKIEVTPIEGLKVIGSGTYRVDLNDADGRDYAGVIARGDVKYDVFGLTLNPYVHYRKGSYAWTTHAEEGAVDTYVGLEITGSPVAGLDLNVTAEYELQPEQPYVLAWGVYTSEFNPGFVKSAKTQIAGVAEYDKPDTDFYGYLGSDLVVTDQLSAKVGALTKDYADKPVAHAALTYKVSSSVTTTLAYTYRGSGEKVSNYADRWRPFDDGGKNFFKASVKGTVGKSTITLAYGNAGLSLAPCDYSFDCDMDNDFHVDKPWTWLYHKPGFGGYQQNYMNWQLFSVSCSVPF